MRRLAILPSILLAVLSALPLSPARPTAAHIEKQGMPDAVAQMEYQILLEFDPNNTTVRNQLGMVYYRLEKFDAAMEEFNRVLLHSPDNFDAIDGIGLVDLKAGRGEEAMKRFRHAISLNPTDPLVYYHLGQAMEQTDNPASAIEAYTRALANMETLPPDKWTPQLQAERENINKRLSDLQPQPAATP